MPRDLTHVILADDICANLDKQTAENVRLNKIAFHMGAISPDTFLYGSDPVLSTKMHGGTGDDTRGVILSMLDDIRQEKDVEKQHKKEAFAFGFLSHVATDTVFHPFVYSVSGSQVPENNTSEEGIRLAKARHRYTETWLDVHFLDEKEYNFKNFRPMRQIAHDTEDRKFLGDFFCDSFKQAFNVQKDIRKNYKKSMAVQLFLGKITQNQTVSKALRRLDNFLQGKMKMQASGFYQSDRQIPEKLVNFDSYAHPVTGQTEYKTLASLTKEAVKRGVKLITAAQKYIGNGNKQEFLNTVPNTNLDTGIDNTKLSDIKQASPMPINDLKGSKIQAFCRSGEIKTMTSGASAEQNPAIHMAHPGIKQYWSHVKVSVNTLIQKFGRNR